MALKVYRKAKPEIRTLNDDSPSKFKRIKTFINTLYTNSVLINTIIPLLMVIIGIYLLSSQIIPPVRFWLESTFTDKYNQDMSSVIDDSYYKNKAAYISDPENGYFTKLIGEIKGDDNDLVSKNFKGDFQLSIPKINITNANVRANVPSNDGDIYRPVLAHNLAHFEGTPIPGQSGNVFIYGHSISESLYRDDQNNPIVAFTKLFRLNLGDTIYIDISGKRYEYTINKIKDIPPEQVEIVSFSSEKTLTLMTCSPPGNSARRLVVIAKQVN